MGNAVSAPLTSNCRNIEYDPEYFELVAECQRKDGTWRWSRLYLNYCVHNVEGQLEASRTCPSSALLMERPDKRKDLTRQRKNAEGHLMTWLKAECAIRKWGLFSGESFEWHDSEMLLELCVMNQDGYLVFFHPRYDGTLKRNSINIFDKVSSGYSSDINEHYEQAQADFYASIGEAAADSYSKQWYEDTFPTKDNRLLRKGT
ncbi:hypothetical protein BT69DRAFT_1282330 [Atractiella rhizophila]|nr:hypothetical protein BT69DRAFT_1282330 [Atractiella rhizophila]